MSLLRGLLGCATPSFPRVSGDEPEGVIRSWEIGKFSPRERG